MNSQVNQLHLWNVIGRENIQLTTVIAPNRETAEAEARKALAQPGRELSYQAWISGGRQVSRS